jgi:hypothetical protein
MEILSISLHQPFVEAAMKPGKWPSAAPWIRRGPTLQERRRERTAEEPGRQRQRWVGSIRLVFYLW